MLVYIGKVLLLLEIHIKPIKKSMITTHHAQKMDAQHMTRLGQFWPKYLLFAMYSYNTF